MRKSLLFTGGLACLFAATITFGAEELKPTKVYQAGGLITVSIEFDGPDISQIGDISMEFRAVKAPSHDQESMIRAFSEGQSSRTSEGVFQVNIRIPLNVVSGEYQLSSVHVRTKPPLSLELNYSNPDIPKFAVEINNDAKFKTPHIKSVTPISKP